jgi:hypothetical protein
METLSTFSVAARATLALTSTNLKWMKTCGLPFKVSKLPQIKRQVPDFVTLVKFLETDFTSSEGTMAFKG